MVKIFISHAWDETDRYESLVTLLNEQLGNDGWSNRSIPRSRAIDVLGPDESLERELDRLENELIQIEAELARPGLSDSYSRVVWDRSGRRIEMPTRHSLQSRQIEILAQMRKYACGGSETQREVREITDPKGASDTIRLHPILSVAILQRVGQSDIVLVLLTPFCQWRRWIEFEIAAAARASCPVVGIHSKATVSRDLRVACTHLVPWEPFRIAEVIRAATTKV